MTFSVCSAAQGHKVQDDLPRLAEQAQWMLPLFHYGNKQRQREIKLEGKYNVMIMTYNKSNIPELGTWVAIDGRAVNLKQVVGGGVGREGGSQHAEK